MSGRLALVCPATRVRIGEPSARDTHCSCDISPPPAEPPQMRLQEEGTAVVSDTTVHGRHCLRAAICNHRTRREDLDLLVRETLRVGAEVTVDDGQIECVT